MIKKTGKAGFVAVFLLLAACLAPVRAETEPPVKKYMQFGFESYFGANRLSSYSPWLGVRFSLSSFLSYIIKYRYQYLTFEYENDENLMVNRKASLHALSHVFYYQKNKTDVYSAISLTLGSDRYFALSLDTGVEQRLWKFLAVGLGVYLLDESSILWFPAEKERMIYLTGVKTGLKIFFTKWLSLNPQVAFFRNDEDVTAHELSLGLSFTPGSAFEISAYYNRYSESGLYQFKGNIFSFGIHYYR